RLEKSPKGKTYNEVSMDGRLEMADFKIDDLKCIIHAPDGQRVLCTFKKELEDEVYDALRGIARVSGLGTYIQPSNRLDRIELYSVKKYNPFLSGEETLVESRSLSELAKAQGVDPTDDLRTLQGSCPGYVDLEVFLAATPQD